MKNFKFKILFLFLLSLCFPVASLSREEVRSSLLEEVESDTDKIKKIKVKSISDLKNIVPFSSVSIIQKRYLPKTFRGEFNLSGSSIINKKFFYLAGGSGNLGFFFREDHGFGIEGFRMYHKEKLISSNLINPPNKILPYNFIFSQIYGGAYYKWSPVFGKFAVLDRTIVYFDMFFTIGGGMTKVASGIDSKLKNLLTDELNIGEPLKDWVPTGSVGLGQVFALSKSFGLSWNLKWYFYFYQLANRPNDKLLQNDLLFSLGVNYYFPGVSSR